MSEELRVRSQMDGRAVVLDESCSIISNAPHSLISLFIRRHLPAACIVSILISFRLLRLLSIALLTLTLIRATVNTELVGTAL